MSHPKPDFNFEDLVKLRGGCQCMHPPYRPPCSACEDPPTDEELEELGVVQPVDHMKAVRDLCR